MGARKCASLTATRHVGAPGMWPGRKDGSAGAEQKDGRQGRSRTSTQMRRRSPTPNVEDPVKIPAAAPRYCARAGRERKWWMDGSNITPEQRLFFPLPTGATAFTDLLCKCRDARMSSFLLLRSRYPRPPARLPGIQASGNIRLDPIRRCPLPLARCPCLNNVSIPSRRHQPRCYRR